VKVDRLEYLLWEVADLAEQKAFLLDFGMQVSHEDSDTLYMRGNASQQYLYCARKAAKTAFIGAGFCVNSSEELETLSRETGVPITPLVRPGGGSVVELRGPTGLVIEVAFGIEALAPIPTRTELLPANTPSQKVRVNQGQRPALEPSAIMKLGHCVTGVSNIEEAAQWYMKHLGLIVTDALCVGDGSPAICFLRLDRGDQPADHHTFVVGKGAGEGYLHSAYEVLDIDSIAQGQQYLKSKKHKHVWGIGRHILGSQLFDYWKDPSGFEFEHYADGDVFTADHPTNYHPLDSGNVYAWGPDIPKSMLGPGPKQVLGILKAVIKGDISLAWLMQAMKSTSRPARPWL
jgi:catechol 2,3-dioxygenase-like lactoylglutathione lyase family enzyme